MDKLPSIYLGTEKKPPPIITLKAGKLTCIYQEGIIRHVRAQGVEILRMIYPAVRDHNWGTIPGKITHEEIRADEDSFSIRYECMYLEGEISYLGTVKIDGGKDNVLTFIMKGDALTRFRKNRIGLNILHPILECSGRTCRAGTPSGEAYDAAFPIWISPDQPMKNIRSLAWSPGEGIRACLEFSGEVFEMEDQRNWTDASYKTYCTPLELPFPIIVEKGETILQEIYLKVEDKGGDKITDRAHGVILPEDRASFPFPAIGICQSSDTQYMHPEDEKLIGKAGFEHYRADLELYREGWREKLGRMREEARALNLPLELGLFFGRDHSRELDAFISESALQDLPVARVLIFTRDHLPDDSMSAAVIPILKEKFKNARIGTGTNANFAELNRNRPDPLLPDFISWSINPQIHAFDPLSLVENLEGQRDTVRSGIRLAGDTPVAVSPVTLRPKFNVVATSEEDAEASADGLPGRFDVRQVSLFCAGWTLGSIGHLSGAGTSSITYYETVGRGGIIHGRHEPLTPRLFPALSGDYYPVYFLFRELLKFKKYRVNYSESSHPQHFSTLLLEGKQNRILCLANHTASDLQIRRPGELKANESWVLDEHTIGGLRKGEDLWRPMADVSLIKLNPYAVVMVRTT